MTNKQILQHPCWGKRYLYTAEQLTKMDAEFTAAVAEDDGKRRVRDDAALAKLQVMLSDGSFHHATYRHEMGLSNGWYIYTKEANGFNGFKLSLSFSEKSHVLETVSGLVRNTGWSLGSYGNG